MVTSRTSKCTELRSARNFEAHGTSKRMELRSARNFEMHGTLKRTELRSARNFEAHGTSKHTERRSARNFEVRMHFFYLNPYYSRTNLKLKKMRTELANPNHCAAPFFKPRRHQIELVRYYTSCPRP